MASKNFARQGKASESRDGVAAYGEPKRVEEQHGIAEFITSRPLASRNFARQGAPSKQGDGVVAYGEPKRVEEQHSIAEFMPSRSEGVVVVGYLHLKRKFADDAANDLSLS